MSSCRNIDKNESVALAKPVQKIKKLQILDKGIKSIYLDGVSNFERLQSLKFTQLGNDAYLSHYTTGAINIHDMISGEQVKKIKLHGEGPNAVNYSILVEYFIHSLDSVFIDTYSEAYYLVNGEGKVLKRIGEPSFMGFTKSSVHFGEASYFSGNQIHGSIRMPFRGTPAEKKFARATIAFQDKLKVGKSIRNELFIEDFDQIMRYRRKKADPRLDNMPRHFARHKETLYATTPLSDSIKVFVEEKLAETIYAGTQNFKLATYEEYVNFRSSIHTPGSITQTNQVKRPAYYINTLIDPDGKYIYRVLIQGTRAGIHPKTGKEFPEVTGATLILIDTKTEEIVELNLPIDEVLIKYHQSDEVFVSKEGIHFRVKDQSNEDEVQFRIFGPSYIQ